MKTITIKSGRLGRYDEVSPFLVESGALELKVALPDKSGEFYLIAELNGETVCSKPIPRDGTVTVDKLEAGELHVGIKHYLRGELIECFKVEPLMIKRVDTALFAMPEIGALKAENEALHKEIAALVKSHTEAFTELKRALHAQVVAFLSFAYAEYENDVQLNAKSLTAEVFAETFGFSVAEFSAEEMSKIKKFGGKL